MKRFLLLFLVVTLLCWSLALAGDMLNTVKPVVSVPAAKIAKVNPDVQKTKPSVQKTQVATAVPLNSPAVKVKKTAATVVREREQDITRNGQELPATSQQPFVNGATPPVKPPPQAQNRKHPRIVVPPNQLPDTKYHGPATTPMGWQPSVATDVEDIVYSTDFENGGLMPPGWADCCNSSFMWTYDGGLSGDPVPGDAHSGDYAACYDVFNIDEGNSDTLFSPSMNLSIHGGSYIVSFWYWDGTDNNGGQDSVTFWMIDNGVRTYMAKLPQDMDDWTQMAFNFSSTSTDVKFAFAGYSTYGYTDPYIDDFQVVEFTNAGRCCYGADPYNPECVEDSQEDCAALGGNWLMGATCTSDPCPALQVGDLCDVPLEISSFPYSDEENTANFNNDYNYHGNDVVYHFTLTEPMIVDFALCNTQVPFDTWMGLWAEGNCGTYVFVTYNDDDDCASSSLLSHISNLLLAPGSYYLLVEAYNPSVNGSFYLDATATPMAAPPNDNCIDVNPADHPLSEGIPLVFTGDNSGATNDCSADGYREVWIPFHTDACMNVIISNCGTSPAQGTLGPRLFNSCPCGTYVDASNYDWATCGDGNWTIYYNNLPPGDYWYPYYSAGVAGPYTCTVSGTLCPPRPSNDDCQDATDGGILTPGAPMQFTGTTLGAINDCPSLTYPEVWVTFTLDVCQNVTIDFCGNTPYLNNVFMALEMQCPCGAIINAANWNRCNIPADSNWTISFQALRPGQYWYPIMTQAGVAGPYTIHVNGVECPPAPSNDNCEDVSPVTLVSGAPVQFIGTTIGATNDCLTNFSYPQVWEAVTLPECMNLTIDYCGTSPAFSQITAAITNSCPCGQAAYSTSYDWTACGDGNVTTHYPGLPAGTYYIPITNYYGYNNTAGPYVLNVVGEACPAPPENDQCANATPIGDVTNLPWSTTWATPDYVGDCITAPDIWYVYTASCNAMATASLCGSSLDTKIAVYDGATCDPLPTLIDCNDDYCDLQSQVSWPAIAGNQYLIQVGGYDDIGDGVLTTYCATPPPNDDCRDATDGGVLTPGTPMQFTGNNMGATADCPGLGYPEVWVTFTLDVCQNVTIDYCGNDPYFINASTVIENECPCGTDIFATSFGRCDESADLNWSIYFERLQPGQYWYPVLTQIGAQGPYTIHVNGVECPAPPENDECVNATEIGNVTNLAWSTTWATADGIGECITVPDIWYVYTASCTGVATASLCGSSLDTKIAVYDGATCDPLPTLIECNDDYCDLQSQVSWPVVEGNQYLIQVGGYDDVGDGVLTTYCHVYPPNNDCADATPVGEVRFLSWSTLGATFDGEGSFMDTPNIWYLYTPTVFGTVNISLCGSSFDTRLAVYDGNVCSPLSPLLACSDDYCSVQSEVTITTLQGHQYLIEIGGSFGSGNGGNGVLSIGPPPVPACQLGAVIYSNGDIGNTMSGWATQCDQVYPFSSATADDFVLPGTGNFAIDTVIASIAFSTAAPADLNGIIVTIYADSSGVPWGNPINQDPNCAHTGGGIISNQTIPEGQILYTYFDGVWEAQIPIIPVTLVAGTTYWLEVQPILPDYNLYGQTGVYMTTSVTGSSAQQYFPLTGLNAWGLPAGQSPADVAFCLKGVQSTPGICSYVVGDANNSGVWTGQDVTYSVRFFKGGNPPQYSCECPAGSGHTWYVAGDVNGSCTFSGQDVTFMVRHFKSGTPAIVCPACPPTVNILKNGSPTLNSSPEINSVDLK